MRTGASPEPLRAAPPDGSRADDGDDGCARLRILQVVLSRGFAGTERAVAEISNALSARHAVRVVVRADHRNAAGASIRDALVPGVEVVEVPPRWRTRASLAGVLAQWRPDLVHTHLRRGTRYVAQLRSGVPHVATLHIALNGPHFLETHGLICISEWQLETVRREGYAGRLTQVPNSLVPQPRLPAERLRELRRLAQAEGARLVVGAVGRLTDGKGFDVLIRAFRRAALPGSRLVIVGDGRARARLERLARGLPVTFTGFRHDAKEWFQLFDVFVSPSRIEPFGRVIVEALDAGAPVIASAAQGPRDIARRYPIELVPVGDVDALCAALRRVHAAPPARLAVDLREFHVDRVLERLLGAYRDVLASRAGPPRAASR